jgi:predicted dehydrogenase
MESSWALNAQDDDRVQVFGDKAGAKITSREGLTLFGEFGGKIADIKPQIKPQPLSNIYREEVLHFLECIREDKEPMASGEHGLIVQKVIDAIYESEKQQEEIKIN